MVVNKRRSNIFDDIYYTEYQAIKYNQNDGFANMKQLQPHLRKDVSMEFPIMESYNEQDLPEGISSITIGLNFERENMIISIGRKLAENLTLNIYYVYLPKKKQLTENVRIINSTLDATGNYSEDIEDVTKIEVCLERYNIEVDEIEQLSKTTLNQEILSNWIKANKSSYTLENMGDVEMIHAPIFDDKAKNR